ncbi:antitoxin MazE [Azorhizobium oxalatiphilum]|uniref:Antitoxin MazE n=1 Tax=Azorhizobium oxalatiphilum TaxID=980631 RepID=A0A917BLI2_9HYPH|nr:antitoxin MazE family protein [Azorhizobium oxalatiphilum]GGF45507.1 antitoxin MazE [Azorhizobium oxalatiphilum]
MTSSPEPKPSLAGKSSREKTRARNAAMRAQGLRPVTIWVPDVNSPAFKAEAARQSRLVAESPHDAEDQAFIDAVTDWSEE